MTAASGCLLVKVAVIQASATATLPAFNLVTYCSYTKLYILQGHLISYKSQHFSLNESAFLTVKHREHSYIV